MVDSEDRGVFDKAMFVTSIHLLFKISQGAQGPKMIPHELRASVTGLLLQMQAQSMASGAPQAPMQQQ